MIKLLFIVLSIAILTSACNRCKDNEEKARQYPKDTALMYMWKKTNEAWKSVGSFNDSGYIDFKSTGDFGLFEKPMQYLDIWYTKNDIIYTTYCVETTPHDSPSYKYKIKSNTLYLYTNIGESPDRFHTEARSLVKVKDKEAAKVRENSIP